MNLNSLNLNFTKQPEKPHRQSFFINPNLKRTRVRDITNPRFSFRKARNGYSPTEPSFSAGLTAG